MDNLQEGLGDLVPGREWAIEEWSLKDFVVAIVMGSKSDDKHIDMLHRELTAYNIPHIVFVASAHRNKNELRKLMGEIYESSVRYVVAVAGMAAALGGEVASELDLPVFGVPVPSNNDLDGQLAKFAISELPPGVAQVAVLADNIEDNCARIANLIARCEATLRRESGIEDYREVQRAKKPPEVLQACNLKPKGGETV